ncbi:MAG: hypothetical protein FJY88_03380 [Candidatus Eisenbacteria bacterium]|nr:hypothetical protein [Candidatus Eisenbacteria bacterium]
MLQATARSAGSRFLANLVYLVPSYHGYKARDSRRAEDARLRARLLEGLAEVRRRIAESMARGAESWPAPWLSRTDRQAKRLDTLADTIRYAPYGFSGFFDADAVSEESLEWILEADLLLFDDIDRMDRAEQLVAEGPPPMQILEAFITELSDAIGKMEEHLVLRDKALGGT